MTAGMNTEDSIYPSEKSKKPHFVLIPFMFAGHTIPMIDMARLLAAHGAAVTLVTTPLNAASLKPTADAIAVSGAAIEFVALPFPAADFGLPDSCESADALPSVSLLPKFLDACTALRDPLVHYLRQQPAGPSCIIADTFHPWAHDVASEFGVPRFMFNGFGCFSLLCRKIIHEQKLILEHAADGDEPFVIPGLAHRVEITAAQTPKMNSMGPGFEEFRERMMAVDAMADGVVANTFDELEPEYVEGYRKAVGIPVWTVGPTLLCNKRDADMAARGKAASIDAVRCLSWLDGRKPGSVVYVSFGSLAKTPPKQVFEIGLGLEASGRAFVWVIKAGENHVLIEEWLTGEDGFEERTRDRGLVIRGWAPQMLILRHPAVGGFVTHCGWNSTMEGAAAGVAMATWPHFAEQFLNEKLVVDVLGIGISMGVKAATRMLSAASEDEAAAVGREEVERAVRRLTEEGGEAEVVRERARVVGEKAAKAIEEGGSSYENLKSLVKHISEFQKKIKMI